MSYERKLSWLGALSKPSDTFDDINIERKALEDIWQSQDEALTSIPVEVTQGIKFEIPEGRDSISIPMQSMVPHNSPTRNKFARKLKLRKVALRQILLSENANAIDLKYLIKCQKLFERDLASTQPLLSSEEIHTVFFKLTEIQKLVDEFIGRLEEAFVNWSDSVMIHPAYQVLLQKIDILNDYVYNLRDVFEIIKKKGGIQIFDEIIRGEIPIIDRSFADLLQNPVTLRSRIAYSMRELVKYTPYDNFDCDTMKEYWNVLRRISNLCQPYATTVKGSGKYSFIKSGYVVQLERNVRKLRYLFLFPNYLIVTKLKMHLGKVSFKVKEKINLGRCMTVVSVEDDVSNLMSHDILKARRIMINYKGDLDRIVRNSDGRASRWDKYRINRLRKNIFFQECSLTLMLPHLRLLVKDFFNKDIYHFLLSSQFELESWRELIEDNDYPKTDVNIFIQHIKMFAQIPRLPSSRLGSNGQRYLVGTLDTLVHQVKGLPKLKDSYLTAEVDCLGGYFMKVFKTEICENSEDPVFNQKFEIPMDCSQIIKICFYVRNSPTEDFELFGTGFYELRNGSLHSGYRMIAFPLLPSETLIMVCISLRVAAHDVGQRRKFSILPIDTLEKVKSMRGKVFEEPMIAVTTRENRKIPLIVTSCVEEVEQRGMDESLIYASCGRSEHVEELAGIFDICSLTGARYLKDEKYSIYTIADLLKSYLKKLPKPILSDGNEFMAAFNSEDKEIKCNKTLSLIRGLPLPEHTVFCYLMDHLVRVCQNEYQNKVSTNVMSRVFGPVLLGTGGGPVTTETIRECEMYNLVINYITDLKINGADFEKQEYTEEDNSTLQTENTENILKAADQEV